MKSTRTGLAVLIAGAIIYAAGSILLARPYVSRPVTLFIAVPVAAIVGMIVLGALAWFAASLVGALGDLLAPNFDFGDRRKKARKVGSRRRLPTLPGPAPVKRGTLQADQERSTLLGLGHQFLVEALRHGEQFLAELLA